MSVEEFQARLAEAELVAIRARDAACYITAARVAIDGPSADTDRRTLLAHVDALDTRLAAAEQLQDELSTCKDEYIRVHGERNEALTRWAADKVRLAEAVRIIARIPCTCRYIGEGDTIQCGRCAFLRPADSAPLAFTAQGDRGAAFGPADGSGKWPADSAPERIVPIAGTDLYLRLPADSAPAVPGEAAKRDNPEMRARLGALAGEKITASADAARWRSVGCETKDGLLNIHDESETCEVCRVSSTVSASSAVAAPDLNTPFDAPIRAQKARDDATNAEDLRRQRAYMATDEFKELVRAAVTAEAVQECAHRFDVAKDRIVRCVKCGMTSENWRKQRAASTVTGGPQ